MPTGSTQLDYIPFLRDIGPHFTINRMLTFDSVRLRLEREQPLTFLEFNYMILQAYDFLELSRRARLPAAARRLGPVGQYRQRRRARPAGRRHPALRPDHAADHHRRRRARWARPRQARSGSTPTSSAPTIIGNSGGTRRTATSARFLRLFTDLPLDEIERLEALQGAEINDAKKVLADAATAMAHGDEAAAGARRRPRAGRSRKARRARLCRR